MTATGITPLMNAAWFGCELSLLALLERGADTSLRDGEGRTALDMAKERGHTGLEEKLKKYENL